MLCRPQEPGNIGATARALRTMGLSQLALVEPVEPWLTEQAYGIAHGAQRLLHAAKAYPDLSAAVADCALVVGTTTRPRHRDLHFLDPEETARLMRPISRRAPVALVFGTERTGLTNEELSLCHHVARIPAAVRQPSLNLSHSVMIFAYAWLRSAEDEGGERSAARARLARSESLERMFDHVTAAVRLLEFPANVEKRFLLALRNILSRAQLREREANTFHTLAAQLQRCLRSSPRGD